MCFLQQYKLSNYLLRGQHFLSDLLAPLLRGLLPPLVLALPEPGQKLDAFLGIKLNARLCLFVSPDFLAQVNGGSGGFVATHFN